MSQETGSNAPKDSVTLIDHSSGRELNLPLMEGTVGPKVIDIRQLYSALDYFTFDPEFEENERKFRGPMLQIANLWSATTHHALPRASCLKARSRVAQV